jgi:ribonuclease E
VLDDEPTTTSNDSNSDSPQGSTSTTATSGSGTAPAAKKTVSRRRTVSRPAGPPTPAESSAPSAAPSTPPAAEATDSAPKDSAPKDSAPKDDASGDAKPATKRTRAKKAPAAADGEAPAKRTTKKAAPTTALVFQPPPAELAPPKPTPAKEAAKDAPDADAAPDAEPAGTDASEADGDGEVNADGTPRRRRRGRRGRGGRGGGGGGAGAESTGSDAEESADGGSAESSGDDGDESDDGDGTSASSRRRRRRRRTGTADGEAEPGPDDPPNTVVHVREPRKQAAPDDGVRGVKGSTRIEAKRQRRRDGRDTQRRRPSIITEAEFLARREAVDRVMVVRQGDVRTQIAVLEDGVLVEHYVTRKDQASMVGNVFLGKVQNVLPSMEAAFVDIGRGRNAVLYAGEVNYDASALEGKPPRIEQALKSGQSVLVQVTKDPIGHKGGRLTSQVSLPGRYMVYVPDGRLSGISRKLPDTERSRLKGILKRLTPDDAGVIIRTAAEGATEEALERDLNRLKAQWEVIDAKSKTASAPSLIYSEPDLVIRVIRDIFNEDFSSLVVQGADEWDTIDNYVRWVAPDLAERATKWAESEDVFEAYRVDEQLAKALDRKVWLPSGGYLVIDRTEAMIVVDVNTGKFTGKGGNLEETVTKNNLEAAEEIVRQLRLRDLGGIIVIDFIDMVLESNRDLVLRRLLECLGRDRTRHQVAEVTSLGLVQMTRKRVGEGLLESFSHTCPECSGSGVILEMDPVAAKRPPKKVRAPKPTAIAASAKAPQVDGDDAQPPAEAAQPKPKRRRTTAKSTEPAAASAEPAGDASPPDEANEDGPAKDEAKDGPAKDEPNRATEGSEAGEDVATESLAATS